MHMPGLPKSCIIADPYSRKVATDGLPVKGRGDKISDIPRKPKKTPDPQNNGAPNTNGKHASDLEATLVDRKRARTDDDEPPKAKKAKVASGGDDVIDLDVDQDSGAFVIPDD